MTASSGSRVLPRIFTKRLVLRLAQESDIPRLLAYLEQNREFLRPFEPLKPEGYYTAAFWRDQVMRSVQEFYSDISVRLFLFERISGAAEGAIIGSMNFTGTSRGPFQACCLGYGLSEIHQGQGLMTEALQGAISYLFDELNLHRIMANYMPQNQRSAAVLKRLGFVIEGHAKDYVQIEGVWRDHVLTSLINPSWRSECF